MKKYIALFLSAFLLMALSVSCGQKAPEETEVHMVVVGQEMTMTFEPGSLSSGTIESAKGTYSFAYDYNGDLKITYPDGTSCTYGMKNFAGVLSVSPDFDPESKGYPSGMAMAWAIEDAIEKAQPRRKSSDGGPSPLLAIFLLALGAWNAFAPRSAWYLARGWQFKNAEPSDAALGMHVLGGIVMLIAGVICLLAAVF